jgi:uncharacterized protein (DUF1697 family)
VADQRCVWGRTVSRFVVLLRGVNVGKGNRVPMAGFRAALEELGHGSVRTLLNSGNAVFSSTESSTSTLAASIANVVEARFGVVTPVIVKSAAELDAIVKNNPFPPPEPAHSRFLVAFAMDTASLQELAPLSSLVQPDERFSITEHAAYLHRTGGLLESKVGKAIVGRTGRSITTRNWATVLKLAALLGGWAA